MNKIGKNVGRMKDAWIWVIVALIAMAAMAGCVEEKNGQVDGNEGREDVC